MTFSFVLTRDQEVVGLSGTYDVETLDLLGKVLALQVHSQFPGVTWTQIVVTIHAES